MEQDTLDISESADLQFTARIRQIMRSIGTWCGITSVLGFIMAGCGVIFVLLGISESGSRINEDEMIAIIALLVAVFFMVLFSKFLLDYKRKLKRSIRNNSEIHLEQAFKGLRNAIIMISIIWILATGIMILVISMIIYWSNYRY